LERLEVRRKMCALAEKFRVLREGYRASVNQRDNGEDYRAPVNQRYEGFCDMRYTDYQAETAYTEYPGCKNGVVAELLKYAERTSTKTHRQKLRQEHVQDSCRNLWANVGPVLWSLQQKQERAARDHELKGSPKSKFTLGRVVFRLHMKRERAARDHTRRHRPVNLLT